MKTTQLAAAAMAAVMLLAGAGCGSVDEEPEGNKAGAIVTDRDEGKSVIRQPDSEDGNDGAENGNDPTADSSVPDDSTPDDGVDSEDDSSGGDSSEVPDTREPDDGAEPVSGSGRYHNKEYGFTIDFDDSVSWKEYDEELVPYFDDMSADFRILMEVENTADWTLSAMELRTQKTGDDFCKEAWDRDYRNSGDTVDKYEVLLTQQPEISGRTAQLITEKLESPNGEFYYGYLYLELSQGDYLYFRANCKDEDTLDMVCRYLQLMTIESGDVENA